MDYEKLYKEAMEKAKSLADGGIIFQRAAEEIFPELHEPEDKRIIKDMIITLTREAEEFPSSIWAAKIDSWIDWLKTQSDKICDSFTEEDFDAEFNAFCDKNKIKTNDDFYMIARHFANWNNPATCSEEDQKCIKNTITLIERYKDSYADNEYEKEICEYSIKWLKSLEHRNNWTPSDDQIETLLYAAKCFPFNDTIKTHLASLYNDLRKIKENN